MTFDGATDTRTSTLDSFLFETGGARVRRRTPKSNAATSTLDTELEPPTPGTSASGLGDVFTADRPYVIEGDTHAFKRWLLRTGSGALLEVVARTLQHKLNASAIIAALDVESDDEERVERVVLLAVVSPTDKHALDVLLDFSASEWWLAITRATDNTLLVDIQRG